MSYKTVALIISFIAFILGVGYVFFGDVVVGRWQIEPTVGVLLLGKRAGCLYVGLAVILFLSRKSPVSAARTSISVGAVVTLLLLAMMGVYEFSLGHASSAILISVVLESVLGFVFIIVILTEKKTTKEAKTEKQV